MICPNCGTKIDRHDIARELGGAKSDKKAVSSKVNGAKGGRPKKVKKDE